MKYPTGIVIVLFLVLSACEKYPQDKPHPVSLDVFSGKVQKGPYLNGASLTIAELNANMAQTGRQFNAQISDNLGSFELKNLELETQFTELKADGFYFNEVISEASAARLILYALANLDQKSSMNVNLLSHLERDRVYRLMDEGMSFSEAKRQAQTEVLRIFYIEYGDMDESEMLDISGGGEDDAILLAVSVILQGYRSVAELSELLANINSDFSKDGELDSGELGSQLVTHAGWIRPGEVRSNLEERYDALGLQVELGDFEKYLEIFLENAPWEPGQGIRYPEFSNYGENILYAEKDSFRMYTEYSMAADLSDGTALTIRLSGGMWMYRGAPNGPVNWMISEYNYADGSQIFTAMEPGTSCDVAVQFGFFADSTGNQEILVEYFENEAEEPTRSKTITIVQ